MSRGSGNCRLQQAFRIENDADNAAVRHGFPAAGTVFPEKPFTPKALLHEAHQHLDRDDAQAR